MNRQVSEDDVCSICLSVFLNPVLLQLCQHYFCRNCLEDSYQTSGILWCPLCRKTFTQEQIKPMPSLQQKLQQLYPEEIAEKKKMVSIKKKIHILLGNTTQFLNNNQNNKYEWNFYVRDIPGQKVLSEYVQKIQVDLHPTFVPKTLTFNPQHQKVQIRRIGWGTFRIGVRVFWKKINGEGFTTLYHDLSFAPIHQIKAIITLPQKLK